MKSAVTISLVPQVKGGPFVFWDGLADGCRRAAGLGFDAVEIFPPAAEAIKKPELMELLDRHNLRVAAIGTGAGWAVHKLSLTSGDAAVRDQAKRFIRDIIDLASEFRAPAIIGSMQGRGEEPATRQQALTWLKQGLEELGEHAAVKGQVLLYEPLNRYETNLFNRVGDAAGFLDTLTTRNIRILADLFHMSIEESSIPAALQNAGRHLGHVHFSDSNRQAIGFGHTSVAPIIEALQKIGYQGYLSAEILPLPDSDAAARQTIASFRQHTLPPC
ncbi:MAG TPA: sugar phosphate isomerase/epimerase family protein [Patescibacteria group bacterium]|nr:sugar phosphate isomerase/epimerase family protein [Patescibacteria group bacterium]